MIYRYLLDMSWTCVKVCFFYDSQLLYLIFSPCNISKYFIQQQRLPHVLLMLFLFLFSRTPFHFLIVIRYIAVDMILYPYTLPIDNLHHSYSSLCLSCNLSQAQDHNTEQDIFQKKLKRTEYGLLKMVTVISTLQIQQNNNQRIILLLICCCASGSLAQYTHTSYRGYHPLSLLWHLCGTFSVAFLLHFQKAIVLSCLLRRCW